MTSANNKQNIILWQQIIAVDVKYNSFRNSNFSKLIHFHAFLFACNFCQLITIYNNLMNNIYLFFCIKENLYIKRRNQLIGKIARKDCHEFRKQYFALRCQILNSKYGISYDQM